MVRLNEFTFKKLYLASIFILKCDILINLMRNTMIYLYVPIYLLRRIVAIKKLIKNDHILNALYLQLDL